MAIYEEKTVEVKGTGSIVIKHSQIPIESPKLFNTPASHKDNAKKYTFYADGKVQKIESFDEEHRLAKEKLFSKNGRQEIVRNYEYLKNPAYKHGYVTRIEEYNLLTGENVIKEISPDGALILFTGKDNAHSSSKILKDSGNLKLLSDFAQD